MTDKEKYKKIGKYIALQLDWLQDIKISVSINGAKYMEQKKSATAHMERVAPFDEGTETNLNSHWWIVQVNTEVLFEKFDKGDFDIRYGKICRDVGIPFTRETLFTLVFLHEVGHLEFGRLFITNNFPLSVQVDYHHIIKCFLRSAIRRNMDEKKIDTYQIDISYLFDPVEMFSEYFALRNFPYIFQKLKENNMIEGE